MTIGVYGHGVVGLAVERFLSRDPQLQVMIFDKFQFPYDGQERKDAVSQCDLVFICVHTPIGEDGLSCDVSAVEECVSWIDAPTCIRSTIPPGTVDRLAAATGKSIAFSPEYLGEQPGHHWRNESDCGFLIVGGTPATCELVRSLYTSMSESKLKYFSTTARAAEICEYMENWLADTRIGSSHSSVTAQRGFRGRCLPKKISAIVAAMQPYGGSPLLEAVMEYNTRLGAVADAAKSVPA